MSDDPVLAGFLVAVVDEIFAETVPGATTSMDMPVMVGMRVAEVPRAVAVGARPHVGPGPR